MSIRRTFQAQPTSEEVLKKVEMSIVKEAKSEEKNLKHLIKDLGAAEKTTQKAQKAADKAEHHLQDAEKKENDTLKALHKAEHKHDEAVSNVHMNQNDLQMKRRDYEKAEQNLQAKKNQVDGAIKANDQHTVDRNAKLTALHGPAGNTQASRVVEEATGSRAGPSGSTAA